MASQLAATSTRIAAPNSNAAIIASTEPKLSDLRSCCSTSRDKRLGKRGRDQPLLDPARNVLLHADGISGHSVSPNEPHSATA